MESNNKTKLENFKNAICYIPFVSIWVFFIEKTKSKDLQKHIKYSTFLLGTFIIVRFFFSLLFLPFGGILFLIYAVMTGYLGYKAYFGKHIQIDYIDAFEGIVKKNFK